MTELTGIQICKRIAEIEYTKIDTGEWKLCQRNGVTQISNSHGCEVFHDYNPLTDDRLLGPLIKKYIQMYRYDVYTSPEHTAELYHFTAFHGSEVIGTDYARTALESIIEAHKE